MGYIAVVPNQLSSPNPAYTLVDFFRWFPAFAGTPVQVTGTLDGSTGWVTGVSDVTKLAVGQLVTGTGIQSDSLITQIANTMVLLSKPTTESGPQTLTAFTSSPVPAYVVWAYTNLANSSILQVRYQEMWSYCMALYIAHYLTLWSRTQGGGGTTTAGQIAASGLAIGIQISKHVGDVSSASQPLKMPEEFGTYALTIYGQELITFALAVGSGPVWLW